MEYFAKIEEPKKLRLSMMNAAKGSIIMSSILEEIENIREQKLELMESIKDDFKCIEDFCKEMSNLLGDEKTRQEMIESFRLMQKGQEQKEAKEVILPKIKVEEKFETQKLPKIDLKAKTEVDRLDYTLKQIEERIASLSK